MTMQTTIEIPNFFRPSVLLYHIGCMLTIVVDNCLIIFCQPRFYTHILIPAKNIALVASAMAKMQSVVGYFESSTQAMTKLLDFQHASHLSIYKDQHQPKKPLQDVVTRWWSTYCSITRLRFLKNAIRSQHIVSIRKVYVARNCYQHLSKSWVSSV
jgi:hypothetical protein